MMLAKYNTITMSQLVYIKKMSSIIKAWWWSLLAIINFIVLSIIYLFIYLCTLLLLLLISLQVLKWIITVIILFILFLWLLFVCLFKNKLVPLMFIFVRLKNKKIKTKLNKVFFRKWMTFSSILQSFSQSYALLVFLLMTSFSGLVCTKSKKGISLDD